LELLGPITLFVSVYLATFLAVSYGGMAIGMAYHQWAALISAICATAFTIRILERGRWPLGVFVPLRLATRDFVYGALFASVLVLIANLLVVVFSNVRQVAGGGFPVFELVTVFIPAAVHEELLFRGYLFQKTRFWNRAAAIAIMSLVFAAMHGGNQGISVVAIVNLILAGILLALAYERYERLWFPIGIHLTWNILSGPLLGYGVSGYVAKETVFRTIGAGPAWITGGGFGIEGSLWMGLVEVGGIFWLTRNVKC
jgi:membrane protease YdiL (CAAX protease family)